MGNRKKHKIHKVDMTKVLQKKAKGEKTTSLDVVDFVAEQLSEAELQLDDLEEKKSLTEKETKLLTRMQSEQEFFMSLASGIKEYGSLTERQEAVVKRMMRRNTKAALPLVGTRVTFVGEVVQVKGKLVESFKSYQAKVVLVTFYVFDAADREVVFSVSDGSRVFTELGLDYEMAGGLDDPTVKVTRYPSRVHMRGTVKWLGKGQYGVKRVQNVAGE